MCVSCLNDVLCVFVVCCVLIVIVCVLGDDVWCCVVCGCVFIFVVCCIVCCVKVFDCDVCVWNCEMNVLCVCLML